MNNTQNVPTETKTPIVDKVDTASPTPTTPVVSAEKDASKDATDMKTKKQ